MLASNRELPRYVVDTSGGQRTNFDAPGCSVFNAHYTLIYVLQRDRRKTMKSLAHRVEI